MTGPLRRLGAVAPIVIRKLLKRVDPQSLLVSLTQRGTLLLAVLAPVRQTFL